jgi:hypothetical protein
MPNPELGISESRRRADMTEHPEPQAHPTKWTVVVWRKLPSGQAFTSVYDFDTQGEAEDELEAYLGQGKRAYILPPKAWGGKY